MNRLVLQSQSFGNYYALPAADSPSGYVENLVGTGALLKIDTDY